MEKIIPFEIKNISHADKIITNLLDQERPFNQGDRLRFEQVKDYVVQNHILEFSRELFLDTIEERITDNHDYEVQNINPDEQIIFDNVVLGLHLLQRKIKDADIEKKDLKADYGKNSIL